MIDKQVVGFLDRMRQFIGEGQLEKAIQQVSGYLRGGTIPELHNEAVSLSFRLVGVDSKLRRGLITPQDADVQRNVLAQSALGFLDEIEKKLLRSDLPFPEPAVSFEPPPPLPLEKIFGISHLKTISWLQRGLLAATSVCRVLTPNGLGTGFLIGSNRLMTNHHVIPGMKVAMESKAQFNYQENLDQSVGPAYSYRIKAEGLRASADLDYCVTEVAEEPANPRLKEWGCLNLTSTQEVRTGDHVPIIQHPQGGLKQIAVTANQVANVFGHLLQYTTDTLPGSSGSPVFNDDWAVIALHHSGGNLLTNARGDRMFANEGVLMNYIVKDLGF
jgi:V8-like Glu-specific endopeptidase